MVNVRRIIGITQVVIGILLIIGTVYLSNYFAVSQIALTQAAAAEFTQLEQAGAPMYASVHSNYILSSNMRMALMINVGISTLIVLLALMMILQGVVNKFAIPKLDIGYKPVVWLILIGLATVLVVLLINQWFLFQYF